MLYCVNNYAQVLMKIREANIKDTEGIKNIYLQAFDDSEAELVSDVAINLLQEKSIVNIISSVAIENNTIIAHTAFSPVFLDNNNKHFGYILADHGNSDCHRRFNGFDGYDGHERS